MNREPIVPQTIALPIKLYYPLKDKFMLEWFEHSKLKYQKFMTYPLVHNIYNNELFKKVTNLNIIESYIDNKTWTYTVLTTTLA